MPLIQLRMFFSPQEVHLSGLERPLFKDLAQPFLPVMHLWGINPGPNLPNRGIQRCQDWLSGLTADRCVYVRVDVRAAGPPSDGTNFLFTLHAKCLEKCCIIADVYIYMCIFMCIIRKEVDLNASASVCPDVHPRMFSFC